MQNCYGKCAGDFSTNAIRDAAFADDSRVVSAVRLAGFEPATYGLGNRPALAATDYSIASCDTPVFDLADCLALLRSQSPDLAAIVKAWPTLPEPIRRAVLALVEASR